MALENILSQEIVQKLGWTLLHFIWQAAAVALLLGILLALLRKSSASMRYIVACAALGLIVLLPIVTMQLVPVSTPQPAANLKPAANPSVLPVEPVDQTPLTRALEYMEMTQPENVGTATPVHWKQQTSELLESSLPYIVAGWLLGVFGLSLWHLGGWAQLQRLRKKMVKQVDGSVRNRLCRLAEKLDVKQTVQLLESALVQVPTVVGWLRPVILLPASALTGLTTEQLEALLAHELAHIRRYDYLVNILQTVVETLGFYHPAVWWVSHRIRFERENCCDDLAISISGDRVSYARALTSMEEIRGRHNELAVAAAGGNLFGRIRRLVGKDSTESSRTSWIPSIITIMLIAIIVIPTTIALTAQNKTQHSAKSLLDKMLEHRSRVRNLQYVAENNIWRNVAAEEVLIENQIKSMRESGIPKRQLERLRQSITEAPESRYQILKCTIDDAEHTKIEQTGGTYDSSGNKVPRGDKHSWAWNGILATDFSQISEIPGSAIIRDKPQVVTKLGHPWRSFTGIFCKFLQETIAVEKPVSVEKLKDGTYRVAFDYKTSRYVAVVDPSKGYTCSLQETYNEQGQFNSRTTATYEEVAEGIWFPVSGQRQEYTPEGTVRYRSIAKSSQVRINIPAFNTSYFDVDMPEGTAVRDEVQNKQYVVGSERVYDLDEPQKPSAEEEQVDPNSWQEKFYALYRLEAGQVLKRIAPPFIPERRGYLKSIQPGRYSPNTPLHVVSQYFNWDGKLSIRGARVGSDIPRLKSTLESVIGLGNRQYDIPTEILSADMSGDWIVRKDTPQEELLQALEQIIKEETSRDVDFVKQEVETNVIIAKGKYNFQFLPNITDGQYVLICTNNTDTYTGGGGGSGTLDKFLRWVGNRVGMNIIDETEAEGVKLSWRNHDSSELSRLNHDTEPYNQRLGLLLNNLSRQTGLTFERETATVEKWFISENGTIKSSQPAVPEGAMPTPATADVENETQQEQLNKILAKFSDGSTADISDNNSKSIRESVESYIATALVGEDKKATDYAYPGTAVAVQTNDMREALQGQDIRIVGMCIGEWNSMAISSVIQADHGRTGSLVFHLKKMFLEKKVHWLIDDIDIEAIDSIGNTINYFLNNAPDAKTIIISADKYANKQTEVSAESGEGSIEGRIIDINSGKGIAAVQLAAVPNSSPASNNRFSCTSGQDGAFAIGGLQSGEYLLQGDFLPFNVDVVSGRSTNDVLIGIRRRKAAAAPKETTAEQQRGGQIMIGLRVIEMSADVMKEAFGLNENLSSGLLVQHGHEIAGQLLTLSRERKDAKLIAAPQMILNNNSNGTMAMIKNEFFIRDYEPIEGEPGKFAPQLQPLEIGWKFKIHAKILESGEKVHIELATRHQLPGFDTRQYQPGYDYQIPSPPEIFVTDLIAKNGEPFAIGRLSHGETAYCLIGTPSVILPERQPESLVGKKLPEPDNIQNIDSLKQAEGKQVLVCFWDMNQRPSRNFIIDLDKRENELKAKDVAVILVDTSQDESAKLNDWLNSRNITFPCGSIKSNPENILFTWGVRAQPWLILTGENRIVHAEGFGLDQLDEKLKAEESTANNSRVPVLAKSAAASDEDKSIVKVDLSVVEVPTDLKMDRETITAIRNLLADKITIPDSPGIADLLRKAAKATAAVKDESAGNKRVTQKEFNTLFDLLISRGYLKILMRPTLEVVDGQTAKIRSSQKIPGMQDPLEDSIRITPDVSKDGNIILQVEAILNLGSAGQDNEQTPIISTQEIATSIRLSPGENGIIGGLKQSGLIIEPAQAAKEIVAPAEELLVILTPTIVETTGNQQDGIIVKDEATVNKEYEVVLIRYADVMEVAEHINKALQQMPEKKLHESVFIHTIEPTRQIIIFGRSDMREMVKKLIAEIDKQPGIDKATIMIEARILKVDEDFLNNIGLDANSISDPNAWQGPKPITFWSSDSFKTYNLVLDEINVAFLLKAAQAHKDTKMLTAPRATVRDGETAEMGLPSKFNYIAGYIEPNHPSDKPKPKLDSVELGKFLTVRPQLTPDKKNIHIEFESEIREMRGVEERKYKGKYPYQIPQISVVTTKTSCLVPDGKTLLNGGQKITQEVEQVSRVPWLSDLPFIGGLFSSAGKITEQRTLLIMVKPSTDIKDLPTLEPLDPNDPLIKQLEEKFNRSAEQK